MLERLTVEKEADGKYRPTEGQTDKVESVTAVSRKEDVKQVHKETFVEI